MATANESLFDRAVSHQIGLLRFSGHVRNRVVAHLNRVEDDLIRQMRTYSGDSDITLARLDRMLRDVRDILDESQPETMAIMAEEMTGLASHEVDYQDRAIRDVVPVRLELTKPTAEQLRAGVMARPFQGRLLREWVSELDDGARRRIRDAVRIGWTEGETIDQMARRIRGTRAAQYRDGVMEITRRGAQAMVRTAVNHTATYARDALYAANDDLIKGIRWVSTLDARTTAICASRDGKVYPVDSGPRPPAHIGCRSTTTPILASWREMGIDIDEAPAGTRASLDGQVPAETTYGEWLKRQPVSVQDEVLGKTKATLFRKGGMEIGDFVDTRGNVYTLDQLRARDAAAFARAGL